MADIFLCRKHTKLHCDSVRHDGLLMRVTSSNYAKTPEERALWLRKLKEDIAQREREAAELEASLGDDKRRNDGDDFDSSSKSSKRMKKESVMTAI